MPAGFTEPCAGYRCRVTGPRGRATRSGLRPHRACEGKRRVSRVDGGGLFSLTRAVQVWSWTSTWLMIVGGAVAVVSLLSIICICMGNAHIFGANAQHSTSTHINNIMTTCLSH